MRLKVRHSVTLSSTSAEEEDVANFKPTAYEVSDALGEGNTRTYKVPTGTTNQAVDLGGLSSVNYVHLRTNKTITIRLNGTDEIEIKVLDGMAYGYFSATPSDLTGLDITNASGSTAQVTIILAGDES